MRRARLSSNLRLNRGMGAMRLRPRRSSLSPGSRFPVRLIAAGVIVLIGLVSYFGTSSVNPVTGRSQRVALDIDDEIAIGLQAEPAMLAQYGGLSADPGARQRVDAIGLELLGAIGKQTPWNFEFHLLSDRGTINAFALPGGQVFITRALYDLLETDGQLAGVLGHEVGHVLERHGAQQMAKGQLTSVLVVATGVASDDARAVQAAAAIGRLVNMSYGRGDELESDRWGVELLAGAGYDPRAMIRVMEILRDSGGGAPAPEFFSTHPDPENRIGRIKEAIAEVFPDGVPSGLRE